MMKEEKEPKTSAKALSDDELTQVSGGLGSALQCPYCSSYNIVRGSNGSLKCIECGKSV